MLHRINWALMLATLASAFALYTIKYDTRRLEVRVQAQERALEKAESDVNILVAERAHLARPERLEPLARLIGLAPITSAQYMRIGGDVAREPASTMAGPNRGRIALPPRHDEGNAFVVGGGDVAATDATTSLRSSGRQ